MPLCVVFRCNNYGGHRFPRNEEMRKKWVQAIRRNNFTPSKCAVVCSDHFLSTDYKTENFETGEPLKNKILKSDAVPSVFLWKRKLALPIDLSGPPKAKRPRQPKLRPQYMESKVDHNMHEAEGTHLEMNDLQSAISADDGLEQVIVSPSEILEDLQCFHSEELEVSSNRPSSDTNDQGNSTVHRKGRKTKKHCKTCKCRTKKIQLRSMVSQTTFKLTFSYEQLIGNPQRTAYYTGLESYEKFCFILQTLGPAAHELNYRYSQVVNICVEDQLFMTLMKLRRGIPDLGLAMLFDVSKKTVQNIVVTWINFMALEWRNLNIWPSKDLVWYYMPDGFKSLYPSTRSIIDGTEFPINASKDPVLQQSTFSTYKNTHTLKNLVGCTPGGLINYCSDSYGGSTSDRAIVERSDLPRKCDPGDSIMADRGFTVQDLFAPSKVTINIPAFLKGRTQLPGVVLMKDRKLASKRVHIERIIGMCKTYRILKKELVTYYVPLGSEIFFICCMLCNFRECIVHSKA